MSLGFIQRPPFKPTFEEKLLQFVIKKHKASRLHYDLRFEYLSPRGIWELLSFVIPRGVTLDPTIWRKAIHVEDHSLSGILSEGVIPFGKPGAGPMQIWDHGVYRINYLSGFPVDMLEAFEYGIISFELIGRKLYGRFRLERKNKDWIIIKVGDEWARPGYDIVADQERSVLTGRTLEEIERGVPAKGRRDISTGSLFSEHELEA